MTINQIVFQTRTAGIFMRKSTHYSNKVVLCSYAFSDFHRTPRSSSDVCHCLLIRLVDIHISSAFYRKSLFWTVQIPILVNGQLTKSVLKTLRCANKKLTIFFFFFLILIMEPHSLRLELDGTILQMIRLTTILLLRSTFLINSTIKTSTLIFSNNFATINNSTTKLHEKQRTNMNCGFSS